MVICLPVRKSPNSDVGAVQIGAATRPASTQPATMKAMPKVTNTPRFFEGMVSEKQVVTMGMQEPTPKPAIRRHTAKMGTLVENACGSVNRP